MNHHKSINNNYLGSLMSFVPCFLIGCTLIKRDALNRLVVIGSLVLSLATKWSFVFNRAIMKIIIPQAEYFRWYHKHPKL